MTKGAAAVLGLLIGAGAGVSGAYIAWHNEDSRKQACSPTEHALAERLVLEAGGDLVDNRRVKLPADNMKPRRLSAAEVALVRDCGR